MNLSKIHGFGKGQQPIEYRKVTQFSRSNRERDRNHNSKVGPIITRRILGRGQSNGAATSDTAICRSTHPPLNVSLLQQPLRLSPEMSVQEALETVTAAGKIGTPASPTQSQTRTYPGDALVFASNSSRLTSSIRTLKNRDLLKAILHQTNLDRCPVGNIISGQAITLPQTALDTREGLYQLVRLLRQKAISQVVLLDREQAPAGVVTYGALLAMLDLSQSFGSIPMQALLPKDLVRTEWSFGPEANFIEVATHLLRRHLNVAIAVKSTTTETITVGLPSGMGQFTPSTPVGLVSSHSLLQAWQANRRDSDSASPSNIPVEQWMETSFRLVSIQESLQGIQAMLIQPDYPAVVLRNSTGLVQGIVNPRSLLHALPVEDVVEHLSSRLHTHRASNNTHRASNNQNPTGIAYRGWRDDTLSPSNHGPAPLWGDPFSPEQSPHMLSPMHFHMQFLRERAAYARAEREHLSTSEQQFRQAIANAPCPIMIHAEDGEILQLNDAWVELTGYTREQLSSTQAWTRLAYGEEQSKHFLHNVVAAEYEPEYDLEEQEFTIQAQGDRQLVWTFHSAPLGRLPDGRRLAVSMAMDVTKRRQAEAKLRTSERLFREIFENSALAITIQYPPDYPLAFTNPAFQTLSGYSAAELASFTCNDLTVPEDRQRELELLQLCWAGDQDFYQMEKRLIGRDGSIVWANVVASFVRDAAGDIQFCVVILEDITDRKRAMDLELSHHRDLRDVLFSESTDALFFTEGESWTIIDCNQRAIDLFEASDFQELLEQQEKTSKESFLFAGALTVDQIQLTEGDSFQEELEYTSLRGNTFWGWISAKQIQVADTVMNLVKITDISDRKQVELDMQSNMQELRRLNLVKDDFISTVSHELRTPLATITMASSMLRIILEQPPTSSAATSAKPVHPLPQSLDRQKIAQYLNILQDQCREESQLIDDLLDLQRLNADAYELDVNRIELGEWLADITYGVAERARQNKQQFTLDIAENLPNLYSDMMVLRRILSELLNNACKYTPTGEAIQLSAQLIEDWGALPEKDTPAGMAGCDAIQFVVSNTGVEITPEDQAFLFDPFFRCVEDCDRWSKRGTGLGLHLAQKFVRKLQGNLTTESRNLKTSFVVTVPVHAQAING